MGQAQNDYHARQMAKQDPEYLAHRYTLRVNYYEKLRADVFAGYGGKCACCGESESEFLQLDHVDGGGNVDRKTRATKTLYAAVRREGYPPGFQLLCANCNQAKSRRQGCPHQREKLMNESKRL